LGDNPLEGEKRANLRLIDDVHGSNIKKLECLQFSSQSPVQSWLGQHQPSQFKLK
jgi:hypothetical protein